MSRTAKVLILVFCFTLLLSSISYGAIKLDRGALSTKYVVKFQDFRICLLSKTGDLLVGMEKITDVNLIKQGKVYKIYIFNLDINENKILNSKIAYCDFDRFEQVVLSDDGKNLLMIGNTGTKISLLNISTMKVSTIFEHVKGKPGFRCEPIGLYYEGKFYVKGYAYNADQYSEGQYIARVDITKKEKSLFENTVNIDEVIKDLGGDITTFYLISPYRGYFAIENEKKDGEHLVAHHDGKVIKIDSGLSITDLVGSNNRVIYNVVRKVNTKPETILMDVITKKKWVLGNYVGYSSISRDDGKVVIVTNFDSGTKVRMSYYSARDKDGYKTKAITDLQHVVPGHIILSADGKVFAYLSRDLIIGKL